MVDLSVCIVNHNAKDLLVACLDSVHKGADQLQLEIIVVDNASSDRSTEIIRSRFPAVFVIKNATNLGFAKPTNQAMRASRGRYVLWLNNDSLVLDDALSKMVDFMDSSPEVGICGPKVLNSDGTIQNQCRRGLPTPWNLLTYYSGLSKLFPDNPCFSGYLMTYFDEDEIREVEAVSGAALLVRREVVDVIGYLDEDFYAYGEDLDYCARARNAGWKVLYFPEARIVHYGGQGGSAAQPYRSIYHFYRSAWLYYDKHLASQHFLLSNWCIKTAIILKSLLAIAVNVLRRRKSIGSAKP